MCECCGGDCKLMSGECEKCGEHTVDCKCLQETAYDSCLYHGLGCDCGLIKCITDLWPDLQPQSNLDHSMRAIAKIIYKFDENCNETKSGKAPKKNLRDLGRHTRRKTAAIPRTQKTVRDAPKQA